MNTMKKRTFEWPFVVMRRNNAFQRHQVSHISQDDCEHEDILFEAHMP